MATQRTTPHPLTHTFAHPGEGALPVARGGGEEGGTSIIFAVFFIRAIVYCYFELGSSATQVHKG